MQPIFSTPDHPLAIVCKAILNLKDAEYGGSIRSGSGGRFTCPVHADERPSLDVQAGRSVAVIANCKVCESVYTPHEFLRELSDAIGVPASVFSKKPTETEIDWGKAAQSTNEGSRKNGKPFRFKAKYKYAYKDETGVERVRITRAEDELWEPADGGKPDKTFWAEHLSVIGQWNPGIGPNPRTPYMLQKFSSWQKSGGPLYLVEGEETVKAIVRAGGFATTFFGGAAGRLEPKWTDWFQGWSRVIVWADRDLPGVRRARELVALLKSAGVPVSAVVSATQGRKDDAVEHLAAGLELGSEVKLTKAVVAEIEATEKAHKAALKAESGEPEDDPDDGFNVALGRGEKPPPAVKVAADKPWPIPVFYTEIAAKFRKEYEVDGEDTIVRWQDDWWAWSEDLNMFYPMSPEDMEITIRGTLIGRKYTNEDGDEITYNVTGGQVREVGLALKVGNYRPRSEAVETAGLVSFKNGHLRLSDREFLPKTPTLFNTSALPFDYSPSDSQANPVEWFKFLDSVGWPEGSPERRLLRQWFGYVLSGETGMQKAMLIVGKTRSGKGVIVRTLRQIVGVANFAGLDLGKFTTNFGLQPAIGKLLISIPDARFGLRSDQMVSVVERLLSITGEDVIDVDRKNRDPWQGQLGARIIMTSNDIPRFVESSNALVNRLLVLQMGHSFLGHEILDLEENHIAPEYAEILRWALEGLEDLHTAHAFTSNDAGKDISHEILLAGSSTRAFAEEHLIEDVKKEEPCDEVYANYRNYCSSHGKYAVDSATFGRELRQSFADVQRVRSQSGGLRKWCYRGLRYES